MRTTLDLPEDLIKKALKITKEKTKTRVIIKALENVIRKNEISGFKKFKGKLKINADLDALRDRK